MGRMHSSGKGIASSAIPYKRTPPSWAKATPRDVEEHVCKLAKKGLTPSQVSARCHHCPLDVTSRMNVWYVGALFIHALATYCIKSLMLRRFGQHHCVQATTSQPCNRASRWSCA
eukprot:48250-Eustigmatos_ZCMA.PRE.1